MVKSPAQSGRMRTLIHPGPVSGVHVSHARLLAATLATVGRSLKAMGLGRLKYLQTPGPVRRYPCAQPIDMIHVDTKQLAPFDRVGYRITGN